jgi:hypothetical protein
VSSRPARWWLAALSLLSVALVAVVDLRKTSPGPLSTVHGRVEELGGRAGCAACHGGWFASLTDSCLECHATIEAQLETHAGLHGRLESARTSSCGACHGEHHGASAPLVHRQSFARAGVPDPQTFDHALVGFEMDGAHVELACSECHAHADAPLLAQGEQRYGGLDRGCVSCHEDPHAGTMAVACASCHGQSTWDELHSLGHERFLPLVGGHADLDCRGCHAELGAHSLEALGARGARPPDRTCAECHANPHSASFTQRTANAQQRPAAEGCVECHAAEHVEFAAASSGLSPQLHALSGFALGQAHAAVACDACHSAALDDYALRFPGRAPDACSRCHADPHGGQFDDGPFASGDCGQCHDGAQFVPHLFTPEMHARAAFELTGSHVETACDRCHERANADVPRSFAGTSAACSDCHGDAHDGYFAAAGSTDCAACHGTQHFADLPSAGFAHGEYTGFDVLGAHAQSSCEVCHRPAAVADANGRRFGRVAEQFGPFEDCATCHADPHAGRFDRAESPATLDGRASCARCHDEVSFRAFPRGFDHGRWTGFALVDAHAAVDCAACHAQWPRADDHGRTWGPANGVSCSACHGDPHAGQFAVSGATDCARCHTSAAERFVSFDHERDARFKLGAAHAALDCGVCHPSVGAEPQTVVQYKPLPIECVDCHGAPEEVLLRRSTGGK